MMGPSDYRREHERRELLVPARILCGETWYDCAIVNISDGGAKLELRHQFQQGTLISLEIGRFGLFDGTIVWQHGLQAGVKFRHDPLEMAEVLMGIAMYG